MEASYLCILSLLLVTAFQSARAVNIGFTESDTTSLEGTKLATLTLDVSDTPVDLNLTIYIMSIAEFLNDSRMMLPSSISLDDIDPAEYSLDPGGLRDFVNDGPIFAFFPASTSRQSVDINITLVDEDINEAEESFLVIIDRNVIIPEDFPTFLRDGIALVNIENDDPIELQFDRTTYTVFEDEEREDEIITVTKGGIASEQVLAGVISTFPNSAIADVDYQVNQTYAFSLFPENATLSVPVTVFDDQIVEITEQFLMTVSVANALATTGDNRTATVFIVDSNEVVVGFENDSYSVVEGNAIEVCVVVKEPQNSTINIFIPTTIVSQDGTAIAMEDYNPISQTVSATTRACIKVSTIDNSETEPNKNFTLDLFFMSVFTSRDFATDTPSITVEIIDNDDPCNNNTCHVNAECQSMPGFSDFVCVCKPGFIFGDGQTCIDFCTAGINDCDINAECKNISSAPFFECSCLPGYVGNGSVCKDECEANVDRCSLFADCIPVPGGHMCQCKKNFVGDGITCDPVCSPGTQMCHEKAFCIPSLDGKNHFCRCGIGFVGNGLSCTDFCAAGIDNCHSNANCIPLSGGYFCECMDGFLGNGFICIRVPPSDPATTVPTTTTIPSTTIVSTTEPATTVASTTEPATTVTSTTEPATTVASTTEPATTVASTTEPATTVASTTERATTTVASTEPPPGPTEPDTTEPATTEPSTTTTEDPPALTTTPSPSCNEPENTAKTRRRHRTKRSHSRSRTRSITRTKSTTRSGRRTNTQESSGCLQQVETNTMQTSRRKTSKTTSRTHTRSST